MGKNHSAPAADAVGFAATRSGFTTSSKSSSGSTTQPAPTRHERDVACRARSRDGPERRRRRDPVSAESPRRSRGVAAIPSPRSLHVVASPRSRLVRRPRDGHGVAATATRALRRVRAWSPGRRIADGPERRRRRGPASRLPHPRSRLTSATRPRRRRDVKLASRARAGEPMRPRIALGYRQNRKIDGRDFRAPAPRERPVVRFWA